MTIRVSPCLSNKQKICLELLSLLLSFPKPRDYKNQIMNLVVKIAAEHGAKEKISQRIFHAR